MTRLKRTFCLLLAAMAIILCGSFPASAEEDHKVVVVIDPGHGGIDGGTDAGTRTEKEYCLEIARVVADTLIADGRFEVWMTREDDTYLTLLERSLYAREKNADLLLSVHVNSNYETYPNGLTAYVSLIDRFSGWTLSEMILDSISAAVPIARGKTVLAEDTGDELGVYYWDSERQWDMPGAWWLGQKSDYYSMNTWPTKFGIKSIIVEHGFASNAGDRAILDDGASLAEMGRAEADAIIDYYTNHTHQFGDYEVDMPSNCMFQGSMSRRCSICGCKKDTVSLDPAPDNHYWRSIGVSDGWETKVCQIEYHLNKKGYDCGVTTVTVAVETEAPPETPAETPEPIEETPEPVEEAPEPVEETPEPVEETPEPVEETSEPAEETSEPLEETLETPEETPEPVGDPATKLTGPDGEKDEPEGTPALSNESHAETVRPQEGTPAAEKKSLRELVESPAVVIGACAALLIVTGIAVTVARAVTKKRKNKS